MGNPQRFRLIVTFDLEVTDPHAVAAADPFMVVRDGASGELGVHETTAWQVAGNIIQHGMMPVLGASGFRYESGGTTLWEPNEDGKYATMTLIGNLNRPDQASDPHE